MSEMFVVPGFDVVFVLANLFLAVVGLSSPKAL
jgi:hypothetical protein